MTSIQRREATPEERKALAHPLRLRILRLCLDEELTNKELAQRLGKDPGSVLFHVRRLLDNGFLKAAPVRKGAGGALEKPYRATGKSWQLSLAVSEARDALPAVDALRDELFEAGPRALLDSARLGVRLRDEDIERLTRTLSELFDEYSRRDDPSGKPVGMFFLVHERSQGAGPP